MTDHVIGISRNAYITIESAPPSRFGDEGAPSVRMTSTIGGSGIIISIPGEEELQALIDALTWTRNELYR